MASKAKAKERKSLKLKGIKVRIKVVRRRRQVLREGSEAASEHARSDLYSPRSRMAVSGITGRSEEIIIDRVTKASKHGTGQLGQCSATAVEYRIVDIFRQSG